MPPRAVSVANKINIVITAEDKASKQLRQVSDAVESTSKSSGKLSSAVVTGSKIALGAGAAGFAALTTGAVSASKASFDQVTAVENARFGLQAYEKDTGKVNRVLSDLVAYAKSDMGVLFNRKDLFAAASTLKLFGDSTDDLTGHVKILSKGVAQGKTTFQELSTIVGRAAAKGRLDAVDFDMLIERGIGIDKKFRGAKVSSEELWKALDKALPSETLAGRADTIDGKMIRLQSAFRGVGDQILGVDSTTNKFIKGGLGDRFMLGVSGATQLLKNLQPVAGSVTDTFLGLIDGASGIATSIGQYLGPKLSELWTTLNESLFPALQNLWHQALEPVASVIGTTFVGALGFLIDALRIALDVLSPFINFMADNEYVIWGIIGAIGAFKTAMFIGNQVDAFKTAFSGAMTAAQTGISTTSGKFSALKTLIKNPIVMPAVAVGAALAAFAKVQEAAERARSAVASADQALKDAHNEDMRMISIINQNYKDGKITKAKRDEQLRIIGTIGNAAGTNAAQGGWTLVGEHGPEPVYLPQGSQVVPNYRAQQSPSASPAMQRSGPSVVIENYNSYNERDDDRFLRDLGFALELA